MSWTARPLTDVDYYDLDGILAEQQCLPATFQVHIPGMGYLDGTEENEDILEGTKIPLPVWLIDTLNTDHEMLVETDLPKALTEAVLRHLRASASKVNLQALCPYYFMVAEKLQHMAEGTLPITTGDTIAQAFQDRLKAVMDHTQTRLEEHTSEFVQGLDMVERDILKRGQDASLQVKRWAMRTPARIRRAPALGMGDADAYGRPGRIGRQG
ncbi:DNA replication protein [Allomyces javanicus]|nr:DNA replication protein [Allomyces javanicus]